MGCNCSDSVVCLCLIQVEILIEKNLLFSITISHLMHLLYSSILLIKISAFCSFRVFIVTCVLSYKSLSTIFLYQVVTLHPGSNGHDGNLWSGPSHRHPAKGRAELFSPFISTQICNGNKLLIKTPFSSFVLINISL